MGCLKQLRGNATSKVRGPEGIWWWWAYTLLSARLRRCSSPAALTGATRRAAALKQRTKVQRLAVERAQERLPRPAVRGNQEAAPFRRRLRRAPTEPLAAARRRRKVFGGEAAIFRSRAAEASGATV